MPSTTDKSAKDQEAQKRAELIKHLEEESARERKEAEEASERLLNPQGGFLGRFRTSTG